MSEIENEIEKICLEFLESNSENLTNLTHPLVDFIESNYIPKEEHEKVYMGRELAEERLHECRNDLMNKTLESAKLKGEYIGTLKGILLWDIPEELKEKLSLKLKELERNRI